MTNYTKTTDFAAKDSLPSGDSGKIIRGSEFETEFDNIATAVNSKSDANNPTFTGTVTIDGLTVNGNTVLGNAATDTVTVTADIASNLIPSADDTYNLGASGAEWNDLYVDGTAYIDAINFNGTAITATGAEINYLDITTLGTVEASKAVTADGGGHVTFPDDKQLRMGASNDLNIYHNSSNGNSIIAETGSGALSLHTNGSEINFYDSGNARQLASFTTAGATTFRHNGDIKFATTSTGIDVTGAVVADGLTVDGDSALNGNVTLSGNAVRMDFIESDVTDVNTSFRQANGDFAIRTLTTDGLTATNRITLDHATGDISFYEDTGTTAKFFWDASEERLGIGTDLPAARINTKGNDALLMQTVANDNYGFHVTVAHGTDMAKIGALDSADGSKDGSTITFGDFGQNIEFSTNKGASLSEAMRIDSSGNVGIGTDSPERSLHVKSAASLNAGIIESTSTTSSLLCFANNGTASTSTVRAGSTDNAFVIHTNSSGVGSERMRIDSAGNVGIGTGAPASLLHVQRNGTAVSSGLDSQTAATFQSTGASGSSTHVNILAGSTGSSGQAVLAFGDADDPDIGRITYRNGDNSMAFTTNTAEAMRLASSGNLLVGKTSTGTNNIGTQITGDGFVAIVNTSNNIPLYLENKATNGNCRISFANDSHGGASLGLNSNGDFTLFDTGVSTTRFNVTSGRVLTASGGLAGIALGGAAASNILDDYEEGTFTPTLADAASGGNTGTATTIEGRYTKVGRQIVIVVKVEDVDTTGMTGANNMFIRGLPFAAGSGTTGQSQGSLRLDRVDLIADCCGIVSSTTPSTAYLTLRQTVDNSADVQIKVQDFTSGSADIFATITYFV